MKSSVLAVIPCVRVSRSDFILKLAQLREHWQGAVQRADQRRSLVEGLVKHWHLYRRSLRKLQRFLSETQSLLPPAGPARSSLQQLRRSLQDLQVRPARTEPDCRGTLSAADHLCLTFTQFRFSLKLKKYKQESAGRKQETAERVSGLSSDQLLQQCKVLLIRFTFRFCQSL